MCGFVLDKTNYTDLKQWKQKSEFKLSKIYLDENQVLLFHTTHMWQIRRRHLLIKVQFIGKIKDTVTIRILALPPRAQSAFWPNSQISKTRTKPWFLTGIGQQPMFFAIAYTCNGMVVEQDLNSQECTGPAQE